MCVHTGWCYWPKRAVSQPNVWVARPRNVPEESRPGNRKPVSAVGLLMQAILLTSSLLLVAGMLGSLAWLSAVRVRAEPEAAPAEAPEDHR